jgi:cell division protein FtsQ
VTTPTKRSSNRVIADPRLTQRRQQIARSKTRRRVIIVGVVFSVVLAAGGGWALLHTSLFSAKTVTVSGATHESDAQVVAAAGLQHHPALISIDAGAAEAGIDALAWVKTSSVSLHWPSTVKITVTERTPVAIVSSGADVALVDASGRVLVYQHAPTAPEAASLAKGLIPIVTAKPITMAVGSSVPDWVHGSLQVAGSLPLAFKGQVAQIHANADGTVTLQLTTPVSVTMGTATQLEQKYSDIASVIAGATLHPGDVLDVTVPQASTITGP